MSKAVAKELRKLADVLESAAAPSSPAKWCIYDRLDRRIKHTFSSIQDIRYENDVFGGKLVIHATPVGSLCSEPYYASGASNELRILPLVS